MERVITFVNFIRLILIYMFALFKAFITFSTDQLRDGGTTFFWGKCSLMGRRQLPPILAVRVFAFKLKRAVPHHKSLLQQSFNSLFELFEVVHRSPSGDDDMRFHCAAMLV